MKRFFNFKIIFFYLIFIFLAIFGIYFYKRIVIDYSVNSLFNIIFWYLYSFLFILYTFIGSYILFKKKFSAFQIVLFISIIGFLLFFGVYWYIGKSIDIVNYWILALLILYSFSYNRFVRNNKFAQIVISVLVVIFFYQYYLRCPFLAIKDYFFTFGLFLLWLYVLRFKTNYKKVSVLLLLIAFLFESLFSIPSLDNKLYIITHISKYESVLDYPSLEHSILYSDYFCYIKQLIIPKIISFFIGEYFYLDIFKNSIPEKADKFLNNQTFRYIAIAVLIYFLIWHQIELAYLEPFGNID